MKTPGPKLRKNPSKILFLYLTLGILLLFWSLHSSVPTVQPREVSYSEFIAELNGHNLRQVEIMQDKLVGVLTNEAAKRYKEPANSRIESTRVPGLDIQPLVQQLEAQKISFSGNIRSSSPWAALLLAVGPLLLIFLIFGAVLWKVQQRRGGPMSFGRNRAKIHDQTSRQQTKFSDVAGLEEAKAELLEVTDFLRNSMKYQKLGGRIPKGVLLVGPPGTGKTLLARAVAGEANVPFFSISGSEFVEMFVGVGASRVRDLFEQAKQRSPCIVFIDELDAIGKSRAPGSAIFSNDEREQTLNQLLVEMDGFDSRNTVIIMAATNRPEVLDPALLRPGRFDRQVVLDRPDLKERQAILELHARKLKISPEVNLQSVAAETPGMVGADLANIVNEAALNAARRNGEQIELRDFEQAVDRVTLGFEKRGRLISPEEKERVAYHEVGHALVALSIPNAEPVRRISIIPRSIGSLGHTLQSQRDRYLLTENELNDRIATLLGGRGAEDIVYNGVVSTGASDDLEQATRLAREMVTRFGMSKRLGNLTYGSQQNGRYLKTPFSEERNYSERIAEEIDSEMRATIDHDYERATNILTKRREDLNRITAALIHKETLERAELDELLSASKAPPVSVPPVTHRA
jgi:cell division protease FtsH